MKHLFTIIILFLIISKQGIAQSTYTEIPIQVRWFDENVQKSESNNATLTSTDEIPRFEGIYFPYNDSIPHMFYIGASPFGKISGKISIQIKNASVASGNSYSNYFRSIHKLSSNFEVSGYIAIEDGKNKLCINIVPLRRNGSSIEKLLSCNVSVSILPMATASSQRRFTRASQSVLADGNWQMIKVSKSGVFRLSYDDLQAMGFSNPAQVSLWGSQAEMLSKTPTADYPIDLKQIPVYFANGADNVFNSGDYLVFYVNGPVTWTYNTTNQLFTHQLNDYSDFTYYYLTDSKGTALQVSNAPNPGTANISSNSFADYAYHEVEDTNLINSGRTWFGEGFDIYSSRDFSFNFPDIDINTPVWVRLRTAARSATSSNFKASANGNTFIINYHSAVNTSSETATVANIIDNTNSFIATGTPITLTVTYSRPTPSSSGWLDFIEVNARRKLNLTSPFLLFRDSKVVGTQNITDFAITGAESSTLLWKINSPYDIEMVSTSLAGNTLHGISSTFVLNDFVAFDVANLEKPAVVGKVENQNLIGDGPANLVIVTSPQFRSYAEKLADLHRTRDGLSVLIVEPQQIYNEFSGGKPDVAAIRNFMKYLKEQPSTASTELKYLLLFGDGTFKNRNLPVDGPNILTYQSDNSTEPLSSYVSDDYYGLLDNGEVPSTGLLDIGIGRFPAANAANAQTMVDKVYTYISSTAPGDWQNQLSFIADDEDNNIFMIDADEIATYVESTYPNYMVEKIYMDAYQQVNSPSGARYPDVTEAINRRVNKGAFIVNYTGHGNEQYLAHERVVSIADIMSWKNSTKLPLFITATCEFSRYDDYHRTSAGEYILENPDGGGVALLSTTRLVYENSNKTLNQNFFENVFEKDNLGKNYRLGDLVKITKNLTGSGTNKLNFSLLGDPALMLSYPTFSVTPEKLNGKAIALTLQDTVKALSKVSIEGSINLSSTKRFVDTTSSTVTITLFDKEKQITTLANDNGTPFVFKTRNSMLFQGKASIKNNQFKLEFIVPKDIAYQVGKGKFYFQANVDGQIGSGYYDQVLVGGISTNATSDNIGPSVSLYLNDENFVDGGITNSQPKLIALLSDSSGINTTGNGIGHDITADITGTTAEKITLNDYYTANTDSYQSGRIEYPLEKLEPGDYTLNFKVWDTYNNSSTKSLAFKVVKDEKFTLDHVLNYPNPFTESTAFYFEHNRPNDILDVLIQIFTISGKLVKTIEEGNIQPGSLRVGPIMWDGKDDFGDNIGRGTYVYKVRVRTASGESTEKFEKLVILK